MTGILEKPFPGNRSAAAIVEDCHRGVDLSWAGLAVGRSAMPSLTRSNLVPRKGMALCVIERIQRTEEGEAKISYSIGNMGKTSR